jgi:hypothetical protein
MRTMRDTWSLVKLSLCLLLLSPRRRRHTPIFRYDDTTRLDSTRLNSNHVPVRHASFTQWIPRTALRCFSLLWSTSASLSLRPLLNRLISADDLKHRSLSPTPTHRHAYEDEERSPLPVWKSSKPLLDRC